jgi:hypothetical protein
MEQFFNTVSEKYVTPEIIEKFALENGCVLDASWMINRQTDKARKLFHAFYASLPDDEKLKFQMVYLLSGINYVHTILQHITALENTDALKNAEEEYSTVARNICAQVVTLALGDKGENRANL